MVTHADHFFTRPSNRDLALELVKDDPGANALIDVLHAAQLSLAQHLPLTGARAIWNARESIAGRAGVDIVAPAGAARSELESIQVALDLQLLESVISRFPTTEMGTPSTAEVVRLACQCVWLSEVLALVVIGVASVRKDAHGAFAIEPATEDQRRNLRRLAFGSAFEKASLVAATAALVVFAEVASSPAKRAQFAEAHVAALQVFPQHWRLPAHHGPFPKLMFEWIEPLLVMMIHTIAASQRKDARPFGSRDADAKRIVEAYEFVRVVQAGLPFIDRLFDVTPQGLILGTRDLAPAAIEMAEKMAAHRLGADWHGDATSEAQKTYLLDRLKDREYVEILDFELNKHHTTDGVALDVDFFVRDKAHGQIYGVQLKHLQRKAHGGLLAWLEQFREHKHGLGNLVRQLENLTTVAREDNKARSHLISQGLTPDECDKIIPVGIHNVGFIDFWEVQNGVLLYDLHTFANILLDRGGVAVGMVEGRVVNQAVDQPAGPRPSLHSPDSVIAACLLRPDLQHLRSFDFVTRLSRQTKIGESVIVADGLGI